MLGWGQKTCSLSSSGFGKDYKIASMLQILKECNKSSSLHSLFRPISFSHSVRLSLSLSLSLFPLPPNATLFFTLPSLPHPVLQSSFLSLLKNLPSPSLSLAPSPIPHPFHPSFSLSVCVCVCVCVCVSKTPCLSMSHCLSVR